MSGLLSRVISTSSASGTAFLTGRVFLDSIRWVGATAQGHNITVTDGAGNTIFVSKSAGPNYVEETSLNQKFRQAVTDVKCTVLGSGTVYLYYRST